MLSIKQVAYSLLQYGMVLSSVTFYNRILLEQCKIACYGWINKYILVLIKNLKGGTAVDSQSPVVKWRLNVLTKRLTFGV